MRLGPGAGCPRTSPPVPQAHLSIHTLRGHAFVPCSLADAVNLGCLHAAAAEGQLLKPTLCLQRRRVVGHPLDRGKRELREDLPLTHWDPWWGLSPPPCLSLHAPEPPKPGHGHPVGYPSSPFPPALRVPPVAPYPSNWQLPAWLGERVPSLGSSRDPRGTSMYSLGPEEPTPFTPDTETERVRVRAHRRLDMWAHADVHA